MNRIAGLVMAVPGISTVAPLRPVAVIRRSQPGKTIPVTQESPIHPHQLRRQHGECCQGSQEELWAGESHRGEFKMRWNRPQTLSLFPSPAPHVALPIKPERHGK
jgi:hypothetical protein